MNLNNDIAVISASAKKDEKVISITDPGPRFVKAGTGGQIIRLKDGRVVGPIGGEALRLALKNGATVVEEKPVEFISGPSIAQQQAEAAKDMGAQIEAVPTNYHR